MSYELISHTKVSGTSTNYIDVQSIPQTYQDLCFWWCGHANGTGNWNSDDFYMRFNNDSGSNYGSVRRYVQGNNGYASQNYNQTQMYSNGWAGNKQHGQNQGATLWGYIPGYRDTTNYQGHKVFMRWGSVATSSTGGSGSSAGYWFGQWQQETAINRIEIGFPYTTYAPDSTFTLYGVKNS